MLDVNEVCMSGIQCLCWNRNLTISTNNLVGLASSYESLTKIFNFPKNQFIMTKKIYLIIYLYVLK